MVNEKELIQQVPIIEAGSAPVKVEIPQTEIKTPVQPAQQAPVSIQPLEGHPVGAEIQKALEKGTVGKDAPEIGDIGQSSTWSKWFAYKSENRGSQIPS